MRGPGRRALSLFQGLERKKRKRHSSRHPDSNRAKQGMESAAGPGREAGGSGVHDGRTSRHVARLPPTARRGCGGHATDRRTNGGKNHNGLVLCLYCPYLLGLAVAGTAPSLEPSDASEPAWWLMVAMLGASDSARRP